MALVVGINSYDELPNQQLERAVNDARLMKETFEQLGFEVFPVAENVQRREFSIMWQRFVQRIEPGSTAAFFFAGHGVQLNGVNYLLPRDIPNIQNDAPELLPHESFDFARLHADMLQRKPKVSILVLDACRNNPFAGKMRGASNARGLRVVKPVEGSLMSTTSSAHLITSSGPPTMTVSQAMCLACKR